MPAPVPSTQGAKAPVGPRRVAAPLPAAAAGRPQGRPARLSLRPRVLLLGVARKYLLWWVKQGPVPVALVDVGDRTGIHRRPSANLELRWYSATRAWTTARFPAARFEGGMWAEPAAIRSAIDAAFFFLGQGQRQPRGPAPTPPACRCWPGRCSTWVHERPRRAFLVSSPGATGGRRGCRLPRASSGALKANLIRNLYNGCQFRADMLFGFRNINLEENPLYRPGDDHRQPGPAVFFLNGATGGGARLRSSSWSPTASGAVNHFYGGQIGGRFLFTRGNWVFDADDQGRPSAGQTMRRSTSSAQTDVRAAGTVATATGGLLAVNNANFGPRNQRHHQLLRLSPPR